MTSASSDVVVQAVGGERQRLRDWLAVPYTVFADDPNWVAPLLLQERQRLSAKHNPFFTYGEAAFFVAYRDGRPVGRMSGQVNQQHLAIHKDQTGQFGFFDCIDDGDVAQALVAAVAGWLRERGMRRMAGPFNLTINQEMGLLIDGFDTPPAVLSPHATPCAGGLLEACGLRKAMDVVAYRIPAGAFEKQLQRFARLAKQSPDLSVRHMDMSNYHRDIGVVLDIFNDAWSDNWGFEPFGAAEIRHLASEMRPIMRGKYVRIVEVDGAAAAMMVALPDLNAVSKDFGGKLLPFNWAKLAHAVWRDEWRTARIPLLGIRKAYRGTPLATALLSLLVADFIKLAQDYKLDWIELSWVLETNRAMTMLGEMAAGKPVKTYRIYEMEL